MNYFFFSFERHSLDDSLVFVMGSFVSSSKTGISNPMAQQFVKDTIAKQRVVIFSKSYCPYCTMAKEVTQCDEIKVKLS